MGSYGHRLLNAILASALLPVRVRMELMRLFGFKVSKTTAIWTGASLLSNRLFTGEHVFINVGFFFDGHSELHIGDNVRLGQFVRVITATHEMGPPEQRCTIEAIGQNVVIEKGCWIGSGVTLLPGVTVKAGCIVAANSLVNESTEPNGLYAGSPARLVRSLPA